MNFPEKQRSDTKNPTSIKSTQASSRQSFVDYIRGLAAHQKKASIREIANPHATGPLPGGEWEDARNGKTRTFWELLKEFWKQVGQYRPKVLFGLLTLTISTILGLFPPLATKVAIDSVLSTPTHPLPSFLPQSWNDWDKMNLLIVISLTAVAITLIGSMIHLWGRWISTQAVNQMQATIRRRVFSHILHLPLHRIHALKSGGATSMLRDDAGGIAELIFSMLYNPWRAIVQLVGSFVVLVLVDWRLLACGLLLLPIVYFTHRNWIHRVRPMYRDLRSQRQRVDASSTETFGGIRVVRTFARQRAEALRFLLGNHLLLRQNLMVWWRTRIIELIWEVMVPIASTVLLLYGGWQILHSQLTIGDLLMFLVYLTMLLGPIATLAGTAVQFQNNLAGLDRVLDLLQENREMEDVADAKQVTKSNTQGAIELKGVGFQYPGNEAWVLRELDVQIRAGSTVALVGRSGAGKTTLCNLIARFFDPTEGEIRLDGVNLRECKLQSYRQLLGVVEQDVFLFDGTVAENISYGRRSSTLAQIEDAAQMAAAAEFIEKLPNGYETRIGERGVKLSGGQRQRLAIARAVLADPKILILDEATSNLDSESERLIQESLGKLMQHRTCLVIAHRLSTIMRADQILVLDSGRIVQRGTHDELLAMEGPYARMVRLQMNASLVGDEVIS